MKEKIILGLGNNIDCEVRWDSKVLEDLIVRFGICDAELHTEQIIKTQRDLIVSVLGFLKSGTGGERFVASSDIIEEFAGHFQCAYTLGGTSARAAIAMRRLGYTSALHLVTLNDHVRRLLPPDCPYVCSAREEGLYPHLIMQFHRGTRVEAGDIHIRAARSNRIIYNNDRDNMLMELDEGLAELSAGAKVFLISGFNAVQDEALLEDRMETLRGILEKLPKDAFVFYEDGCFHEARLSARVRDALMGHIHIYSLNEDELQGYLGRRVDLLSGAEMKKALEDIHRLIPVPTLVVHTRYWALAFGEQAARYGQALKSGITMASTRFVCGDSFTSQDYYATEKYPVEKEGEAFAAELGGLLGDRVCCLASVQLDERNATTVGLGDAFVGGFLPALSEI